MGWIVLTTVALSKQGVPANGKKSENLCRHSFSGELQWNFMLQHGAELEHADFEISGVMGDLLLRTR